MLLAARLPALHTLASNGNISYLFLNISQNFSTTVEDLANFDRLTSCFSNVSPSSPESKLPTVFSPLSKFTVLL